jgi:hypothetical protein
LFKTSKVDVVLVTDDNLKEFEQIDRPFHPGFDRLVPTAKADYLRAYFMYFFGGGYTDIKTIEYDWNPYFDLLEQSDKVAIGYREKSPNDINYPEAKLVHDQMLGFGAFIHKPRSHLAKKWVNYVEDIMTEKAESTDYPFRYTELGGDVWHRVQVENLGCWLFDLPYINMNNYR